MKVFRTKLDDCMIGPSKSVDELEMANVERYKSVFSSKDSATYTVRVDTSIPFIVPVSGHLQSSACLEA